MANYPGARQLEPSNELGGSLAWLHSISWAKSDTSNFCGPEDVEREPAQDRADVQAPLKITKLSWEKEPLGAGRIPIDDIPNPFLLGLCKEKSIYVREDYPALLQAIIDGAVNGQRSDTEVDTVYNPFFREMRHPSFKGGAVVMGSPGIGKSTFLLYLLVLRLIAGRPTVLQWYSDRFYVVMSEGVFEAPGPPLIDKLVRFIPKGTWLLFDSNRSLTDVPQQFADFRNIFDCFIVQAASPRKIRTEWTKKTSAGLFWMSPWSVEELIAGRQLRLWQSAVPTEKQIVSFCEKYGTSPNATYANAANCCSFDSLVSSQLDSTSIETIRRLFAEPTGVTMDEDLSHLIVVARPDPTNRLQHTLDIATPYLTDIFLKRLSRDDERAALRLYWLFLTNSHTRHNAGYMLEKAFKEQFPRGGEWPVTRMKMKRGPANNIWHTDDNARVCYLRLGHRGRVAEFSDTPANPPAKDFSLDNHQLSSTGIVNLKPGIFIPTAANQASHDSFAFDDRNKAVVLFQVTVAPTHDILNTGLRWLPEDQIASTDLVIVTCPKNYEGARTITMKRDDTKNSKNSKEPIKNSEQINVYLLELAGA